MSYDVSLSADVGGPDLVPLSLLDINYTYNVGPMFYKAVGSGPNQWDGKPASEVSAICSRILDAFAAEPATYRAMNPSNGWGSFDGARKFIATIKDACDKAPKAILRVG